MKVQNYPNFIPLSATYSHIKQWNSDLHTKTNQNTYFKCLEGYGEISFQNQSTYKGQIKNGMLHGKGIFSWSNGVVYEGDFSSSSIDGSGKFTYLNGSWYEGDTKNGKRQGKGVFYNSVEKCTYSGEWLKGKMHGKGQIKYADKSFYQGNFDADQRSGYGKMIYPSQNNYEGYWKGNKKEGQGVMIWKNNKGEQIEKYIGNWKEDFENGYGEYYWLDNKVEFKIFKNVYKGYWALGKRQGFGMFLYSNGCRFEGFFTANTKNGPALILNENGVSKYIEYSKDKPIQNQNEIRKGSQTKEGQADRKLPFIQTSHHSKQNSSNSVHAQKQNVSQTATSQNLYKSYLDFDHPQLTENFFNLLLRQNTRLKNLYKNISSYISESDSTSVSFDKSKKQSHSLRLFYSGMLLENYWRVLRDTQIAGDGFSLVELNRRFSEGKKSHFYFQLSDERVVQAFKQLKKDEKIQEEDVLWSKQLKELMKDCSKLNWEDLWFKRRKNKESKFNKSLLNTIHNPEKIILFRHFVCLVVHTAILHEEDKHLKESVQNIISRLQEFFESSKDEKQKDRGITSMPEWAIHSQNQILNLVESALITLEGKTDWCISIRKLYSILEICGMLRDSVQKCAFLDKIQKYLNIKNSNLKKQCKSPEFEKMGKEMPELEYLMNLEITQKQCNELLYACISKKVSSHITEQKHKTFVENMKNCLTQNLQYSDSKANNVKLISKLRSEGGESKFLKILKLESEKDKKKKEHIKILTEQKQRLRLAQLELERQILETKRMQWEDNDVQSNTFQDSNDN